MVGGGGAEVGEGVEVGVGVVAGAGDGAEKEPLAFSKRGREYIHPVLIRKVQQTVYPRSSLLVLTPG